MKASCCLTAAATIVLATTAIRPHLADPKESGNEALVTDCMVSIPTKAAEWQTFMKDICPDFVDVLAGEFRSRQPDEEMFRAWIGSWKEEKCRLSRTWADTIKTPCFYNSINDHPRNKLHHGLCTEDDDCDISEDEEEEDPPFDMICQKFIIDGKEDKHGLCFPDKPSAVATTPEQSSKAVTTPEQPKAVTTPEQSTKAATTPEKPSAVATTPEQSTKAVTTPEQPKAVTTPEQSTKVATTPVQPTISRLTTTKNGTAGNSAGSLLTVVLSLAVYYLR